MIIERKKSAAVGLAGNIENETAEQIRRTCGYDLTDAAVGFIPEKMDGLGVLKTIDHFKAS